MRLQSIARAVLLWNLAACTTWRVQEGASLRLLVPIDHPSSVRITRSDGSRVVLKEPRIVGGNTLVGRGSSPSRAAVANVRQGIVRGSQDTTIRVPVSDVRAVAIRKVGAGRTMGLVLGLSVIAGVIGLAIAIGSSTDPVIP